MLNTGWIGDNSNNTDDNDDVVPSAMKLYDFSILSYTTHGVINMYIIIIIIIIIMVMFRHYRHRPTDHWKAPVGFDWKVYW